MTISEALIKYAVLSVRLADIEDAPCSCEEFHSCQNCDDQGAARSALRNHMSIWGERYADELARREGILAPETQSPRPKPERM